MIIFYLIEFFVFSFVGWGIDSLYSSLEHKKWLRSGYFQAPICPIYGIGGLILVFILKTFNDLPLPLLILVSALAMILVEYLGGIFSEKVLQVRLWDYSKSRFNIGGYIDLVHSIDWFILVTVFYFFVFRFINLAEDKLVKYLPDYLGVPLLMLVIFVFLLAIARKNPLRFLQFQEDVLNLSVADYRRLISNIKSMYKAKTEDARQMIEKVVREQLDKAKASLRK